MLRATQTIIYGFSANGTRPMGKIKLRCHIRYLRSKVTCYVIDADMPYNFLQGCPQIHCNSITPSTLHQVMRYTNEEGVVRILIAEEHSFKGVENYYTNSLLYQDSLEAAEDPSPEDSDSGNETNTELEPEEEYLWKLNQLVTSVDKLDFNNINNVEGEWYINENLDFAYLSALAFDSVLSDTSMDIDSDPLSAIDALTSD